MKVVSLVGARPQFVKEAMLNLSVRKTNAWNHILVHSGQHYDANMSDVFFDELKIPSPDHYLGVGSGSHAETTAAVLVGMEKVLFAEKPDALIVYGDTNTTLGGALAAAKLGIPVAHVEAGIRMLPRNMPEEINRVTTDHLSTVLCCCSEAAQQTLFNEGIHSGVHVCGDIMYDVYLHLEHLFDPKSICEKNNVVPGTYVVATMHRNYNVDDKQSLKEIINGLVQLQEMTNLRVVLPLHPRTRKSLEKYSLLPLSEQLCLINPLGYIELMSLVLGSKFVITDSGGLQKEAYYAGKRCIVIMPDTGWRELIATEWNILCPSSGKMIIQQIELLNKPLKKSFGCYGSGDAAEKIINLLIRSLT